MQLQKSNKACATGAGRWSLVASPHVYTLRILKSQNVLDHFQDNQVRRKQGLAPTSPLYLISIYHYYPACCPDCEVSQKQ
jgi:threonyl-tRNA synthetase